MTIRRELVSDEAIKVLLRSAVEGDAFPYGYRKLTHWLRREHRLVINKKKVYRLCKEMGILMKQRRPKSKHPRCIARNRLVDGVNQLWETDIKYGYIAGEARFFFVQVILDVYDRMVVDYHIGLSCTGKEAAAALRGAYDRRKDELLMAKPTIRTDNGPQFTSQAFEEACQLEGVDHELIPVRTPNKNAHVESFHSVLENDCLSRYEFMSYTEAYITVVEYIEYYNHRRLHGSIGYRPPAEFHAANVSNTARTVPIKL